MRVVSALPERAACHSGQTAAARTSARLALACLLGLVCVLAGTLAGCGATSTATITSAGAAQLAHCNDMACATDAGLNSAELFVEPGAGEEPVVSAIKGATTSVWAEVYLLTDTNVMHALESAANRGIDVRVLLEGQPYGISASSVKKTMTQLRQAGVSVRFTSDAYIYTHTKMMVVDHATLYIMTGNFTKSSLGGSTAQANRDFGIVEKSKSDVTQAEAIFLDDWVQQPVELTASHLVVSPLNARGTLQTAINLARVSLLVEDEEMYDQQSVAALSAAARRGVDVEVILPQPSSKSDDTDDDYQWTPNAQALVKAGVHVRYLAEPYPHAKAILVDGALGFVGSQNFSATSLDENREVGVLVSDQSVLLTLADTFARDWAIGSDA